MPDESSEVELVKCADCYALHRNTCYCIVTGKRIDFANEPKECDWHYPAIYTFGYIFALDQNLHKNEFTKFEKIVMFFVMSAFMVVLYKILDVIVF